MRPPQTSLFQSRSIQRCTYIPKPGYTVNVPRQSQCGSIPRYRSKLCFARVDFVPSSPHVEDLADMVRSNNFTSPCAAFFKRMLSDSSFGNCHPFSLMLQTSSGLFDSSKSVFAITRVLEATCSVNSDQCTSIMDGFARDLLSDANCQVDYANSNPQVLQAYNGLVAYEPLYQASCLRDDGGSYCESLRQLFQ